MIGILKRGGGILKSLFQGGPRSSSIAHLTEAAADASTQHSRALIAGREATRASRAMGGSSYATARFSGEKGLEATLKRHSGFLAEHRRFQGLPARTRSQQNPAYAPRPAGPSTKGRRQRQAQRHLRSYDRAVEKLGGLGTGRQGAMNEAWEQAASARSKLPPTPTPRAPVTAGGIAKKVGRALYKAPEMPYDVISKVGGPVARALDDLTRGYARGFKDPSLLANAAVGSKNVIETAGVGLAAAHRTTFSTIGKAASSISPEMMMGAASVGMLYGAKRAYQDMKQPSNYYGDDYRMYQSQQNAIRQEQTYRAAGMAPMNFSRSQNVSPIPFTPAMRKSFNNRLAASASGGMVFAMNNLRRG